ncbi:DNA translocase FtsK 4TM domain-containing protein [Saccharospirillum sp. HFRX-1]|uniref:DNA translocase FtsK n=1 Tax=unclassified Saccharospirillum TaxID=2633430 RepID=UPI003711CA9D
MTQKSARARDDDRVLDLKQRLLLEGSLLLSLAIGVYLLIALMSYHPSDPGWAFSGAGEGIRNLAGRAGAWISSLLFSLVGGLAYGLPVIFFYRAWATFRDRRAGLHWNPVLIAVRSLGWVLFVATSCTLATVHIASSANASAGGWLGRHLSELIFPSLGLTGATLLLVVLWFISLTVAMNVSWLAVMEAVGRRLLGLFDRLRDRRHARKRRQDEDIQRQQVIQSRKANLEVQMQKQAKRKPPQIKPLQPRVTKSSERVEKERQQPLFEGSSANTALPELSLLQSSEHDSVGGFSEEALEAMSRLLEIKLKDFGVEAEVTEVAPGPVITRFEIQPAAGVKVSKIANLAKDLARSMALVSVRVVEIIPGKTTVGIEIPNEKRDIVRLSDVLRSAVYDKAKSPLTLALGDDISGTPVCADLGKMPHLLVAGTTGSGKSVGVNAMLCSILFKATPEEVRLILVDPKMLELSVYEGIPHLLTPVITDMKDAANGLRWCVAEMERRYKLMASVGVRNLAGFNKKVTDAQKAGDPIRDPLYDPSQQLDPHAPAPELEPMPFIVVVVDEFADMMMIVGKKVEELIARLAQKARAAGIHLILATQRPSVDVITGLIKANIPTRIAFQVSSKIDSRTILDQGGAEQLLGHGDMLYLPPGTGLPVRVHGAFVDDDEVHRVVSEWKKRGAPDYIEEILSGGDADLPGVPSLEEGGEDPEADVLFDEAVAFVTQSRKASISSVQRKLRIGYNRAARLVDAMEAAGIVSAAGHNGTREVLAPPPPAG